MDDLSREVCSGGKQRFKLESLRRERDGVALGCTDEVVCGRGGRWRRSWEWGEGKALLVAFADDALDYWEGEVLRAEFV